MEKGLKVPCLFMITEVSIRCQKNLEVGIRRIPAYTPQYTTAYTDNVAIPALARRCCSKSIDISCQPGPQQQTCSSGFAADCVSANNTAFATQNAESVTPNRPNAFYSVCPCLRGTGFCRATLCHSVCHSVCACQWYRNG